VPAGAPAQGTTSVTDLPPASTVESRRENRERGTR